MPCALNVPSAASVPSARSSEISWPSWVMEPVTVTDDAALAALRLASRISLAESFSTPLAGSVEVSAAAVVAAPLLE